MRTKQTLTAGLSAALVMAAPSSATQIAASESAATAPLTLPHRILRLENGLTLVLMPEDAIPNVGVELWIRGGSREERPGQFGIAHLFEHQLAGAGANRLYANPTNRALTRSTVRATGAGTDPVNTKPRTGETTRKRTPTTTGATPSRLNHERTARDRW